MKYERSLALQVKLRGVASTNIVTTDFSPLVLDKEKNGVT